MKDDATGSAIRSEMDRPNEQVKYPEVALVALELFN